MELDDGYFTTENPDSKEEVGNLKRWIGSQRKAKVLVMIESEEVETPKKGGKPWECGHIKMKVITDLSSDTYEKETEKAASQKPR